MFKFYLPAYSEKQSSFMNSVPPESDQNQMSSRSHNEQQRSSVPSSGCSAYAPSPAQGPKQHRPRETALLFKNTITDALPPVEGNWSRDTTTSTVVEQEFSMSTDRSIKPRNCAHLATLVFEGHFFSLRDVLNKPHLDKHSNEHFEMTQILERSHRFVPWWCS